MLHRIFTAISLPEETKEKLFNLSKIYSQLPAKWISKENLHITLNFLGKLDDKQLSETIDVAKKIISQSNQFVIKLEEAVFAPPKVFPPRMVWVNIEKNQKLLKLQAELENNIFNLPSYQYKIKENQSFSPHITLARIKSFDFRRLGQDIKIEQILNNEFKVNSIQIIESELKREGPQYTILETIALN